MSTMRTLDRIQKLANLIYAMGGEVKGRKRFQKIVFILQEIRVIRSTYDFQWNYYGVYSYDLAWDIEFANKLKILKEEEVQEDLNYITYKIKVADCEMEKGFSSKKTIKELSKLDARTLEVLSSIFYLSRHYHRRSELESKLKALKGHLKGSFEQAFEIYSGMKK